MMIMSCRLRGSLVEYGILMAWMKKEGREVGNLQYPEGRGHPAVNSVYFRLFFCRGEKGEKEDVSCANNAVFDEGHLI